MSYKSEYKKLNIADESVRTALKTAVEQTSALFDKPGWTVVDNEELVANGQAYVRIRGHETNNEQFPVILKNPGTENSSYDIGLRVSEDEKEGMGCDLVYDRYLSEVVKSWGEEANSLGKFVTTKKIQELGGGPLAALPLPDYIAEVCKCPVTKEPLTWEMFMDINQAIEINTVDHPLAQLA